MDFGNACLFNKKPEDMRRIGGLGRRARARNRRLRKADQTPVTRDLNQPHQETAAEAIRRIDALCPWLVGAEHCKCPASITFPGRRQLFLPISDNYQLCEAVPLPYTGDGRGRG